MFARPLTDTTADVFGRIQGRFCVTASNVAKYDAWHGLIIPNEAQPLHFSAEQLEDCLLYTSSCSTRRSSGRRLAPSSCSTRSVAAAGVSPVSYTHLDVYKRQRIGLPSAISTVASCRPPRWCALKNLSMPLIMAIRTPKIRLVLPLMPPRCPMAVSYTHLDVYKRQQLYSQKITIAVNNQAW